MQISAHKKFPPDHCLSLIDSKGKEIPDPIMKLRFLSHAMAETRRLPLLYRLCPSLARGALRTWVRECAEGACREKKPAPPVSKHRGVPLGRALPTLALLLLFLVPAGIYLYFHPPGMDLVKALVPTSNTSPEHSPVFPGKTPFLSIGPREKAPGSLNAPSIPPPHLFPEVAPHEFFNEFALFQIPETYAPHHDSLLSKSPHEVEKIVTPVPIGPIMAEAASGSSQPRISSRESNVPPTNQREKRNTGFYWNRTASRAGIPVATENFDHPGLSTVSRQAEIAPTKNRNKSAAAFYWSRTASGTNALLNTEESAPQDSRALSGGTDLVPTDNRDRKTAALYWSRTASDTGTLVNTEESASQGLPALSRGTDHGPTEIRDRKTAAFYWSRTASGTGRHVSTGEPALPDAKGNAGGFPRFPTSAPHESEQGEWAWPRLLFSGNNHAGSLPHISQWPAPLPVKSAKGESAANRGTPNLPVLLCLKSSPASSARAFNASAGTPSGQRSAPSSTASRGSAPLPDTTSSVERDLVSGKSKTGNPPQKATDKPRERRGDEPFAEYIEEPIWLVDQGTDWELYSNGLRIITAHVVDNLPRLYYRFPNNAPGAKKKERITNRIAGILYHSTESDLHPFLPEMNQSIKKNSRRLIRYVKRQKCYNYLIDRFGQVFRVVRDDHAAFHAGNSLWSDEDSTFLNLNHAFIGISFEARDFEKVALPKKKVLKIADGNTSTINAAQKRSGRALTDWLRVKYRIPETNCVPHGLASINPEHKLIGYHLDLAVKFPYPAFALNDKNLLPLPSMTRYGFSYDKYFVRVFEGNLWPGIRSAEALVKKRAAKLKISPRRLKRRLNKRFDKLYKMKKALQASLSKTSGESTLQASSRAPAAH